MMQVWLKRKVELQEVQLAAEIEQVVQEASQVRHVRLAETVKLDELQTMQVIESELEV